MPTVRNSAVIFTSPPEDYPIPGKHLLYNDSDSIDIENVLLRGGLLVKALALSIDPYQRGRTRGGYEPGKPIHGFGIGRVVRSDAPGFEAGDHIYSDGFPFQEYVVLSTTEVLNKIVNDGGIPWSEYLGVLGMPGKTAYLGYKRMTDRERRSTCPLVLVQWEGAAHSIPAKRETSRADDGNAPSLVCQLAKLDGLRVIASAGSDEKVDFLRQLGVDIAFNYKTEDLEAVMTKAGPVDIYWDNVGGEVLETMIRVLDGFGRIVKCGSISQYNNSGEQYGIKNTALITSKSLTISGFMIMHLLPRVGDLDFNEVVRRLWKEGKLVFKEDVRVGLGEAPHLMLDMLQCRNTGKAVIVLEDR